MANKRPQAPFGQTLEKRLVVQIVRQLVIGRQRQGAGRKARAGRGGQHRVLCRAGNAPLAAGGGRLAAGCVCTQGKQHKVVIQQKTGKQAVFTPKLFAQPAVIRAVARPLPHFQFRFTGQHIAEQGAASFSSKARPRHGPALFCAAAIHLS